jgi:hypothetical protein
VARSLPRHIENPWDIAHFFRVLAEDEQVTFHPDDSFGQYGHTEGKRWVAAYTKAQARRRDRLMREAFAVAQRFGLDIYCMGMWALSSDENDQPVDCDPERRYFMPSTPGVLDWTPPS